MPETAIKVENLGKKYLIRHQQGGTKYKSLREVVSQKVKSLVGASKSKSANKTTSQEDFWALKDVSFEIKKGESVGIIGRNGAGKSTLLKLLSRITEPTNGRIELEGRVSSLLEVGTGFHQELTGRENIYLNGAILGMRRSEIKNKFDEIVAFAEVEKFLDTPVKRYSSGMYMRLAFAVAAHLEPEVLIVDEVLAVGDAQFQRKCLGKMGDVAQEGRTVLFVSHNMGAIQKMCSRILVMNSGKLVMDGNPNEAIRYHLEQGSLDSKGIVDLTSSSVVRRGSGRMRFSEFSLLNTELEVQGEFLFAEPFIVRFKIESEISCRDLIFGFSFITTEGIELQGSTAQDCGIKPDIDVGSHVFYCHIDPNVLVPGKYFLRAAIFHSAELFDHIDEVFSFEIMKAKAAGRITPDSHYVGHVFIPYKWETSNDSSEIALMAR